MGHADSEDTAVVSASRTTPTPAARAGTVPVIALSTAPGHLVRCAQQVHSALWHAEFGGELTSPQYAVLSVLSSNPQIDQRNAGLLTSLDKSNIADVVQRLERRGWLTRVRDSKDGRRNLLQLTDAAEAALIVLSPAVARIQAKLLEPLAGPERERFLTLFAFVAYGGRDAVPDPKRSVASAAVQLSTAPGHLIRRAEQVHYALWSEEFGTGVTSPQYAIISALLSAEEALDQRTAGEVASLDKSSVADVVRRLERRGWLTRIRDHSDGRRRLLRPTPAALYAIPQLTEGVQRIQDRLTAPLQHDERDALIAGLAAIARVEPGSAQAHRMGARAAKPAPEMAVRPPGRSWHRSG